MEGMDGGNGLVTWRRTGRATTIGVMADIRGAISSSAILGFVPSPYEAQVVSWEKVAV
jgi:hypothetical protein